jgi:Tfp pilus assembly protein PilP
MLWKVLWAVVMSGLLLCPVRSTMAQTKPAPAAKQAVQPTAAAKADTAKAGSTDKITLRDKVYYYQAFNQRDPFQSLIAGEFEESGELDVVDIYSVRLVGILSGGREKFAMLEDNNGYAYIMKAGDPIRNGSIVSVTDRNLVARVTMFGQTNTVTLRLEDRKRKGE